MPNLKERKAGLRAPSYKGLTPASELASITKRRNRASNTAPELLLRRALTRLGLRYRLHSKELPGRPDVVFRRARVAVFVDGDFWHGRDWAKRRRRLTERTNASYWVEKIRTNRMRDRRQSAELRRLGWWVARLWETDVKKDPAGTAQSIFRIVKSRLQDSAPDARSH